MTCTRDWYSNRDKLFCSFEKEIPYEGWEYDKTPKEGGLRSRSAAAMDFSSFILAFTAFLLHARRFFENSLSECKMPIEKLQLDLGAVDYGRIDQGTTA